MLGGVRRQVYGKKQHSAGLDLGASTQTVEIYLQRWLGDYVKSTMVGLIQ